MLDRLVAAIVRQFAKPRGIVGRLVGVILANRGGNVRRNLWTVELLGISPRDRVLEIGCGPGIALRACVARATDGDVTGIDHSEVMISQARKRNARAVANRRLKLTVGILTDLPVGRPPFDKVYSINVIQFVGDKAAFVAECVKRLAPGGTLATTFEPRGRNPTRQEALDMARTLEMHYATAGLRNVRTEILEMKPMPAICTLGESV